MKATQHMQKAAAIVRKQGSTRLMKGQELAFWLLFAYRALLVGNSKNCFTAKRRCPNLENDFPNEIPSPAMIHEKLELVIRTEAEKNLSR